jgi:MYXO-CTERM domain-containing protein
VKVKAWAVERPEVVFEDVATITIPDGTGLAARFAPEDTRLTLGETVESQLVVDNWDFGDGRTVEVFLESDDAGLVAEGGGLWGLVAGGSAQGVVRVTPSQAGLVEVRGRAEALDGAMAEAVWRLQVLDPANAPTITGSRFEPAPAEGLPFVWVVEAEDPNGDALVYDADLDGDGAWDVEGASEGRFALSFPDDAALALRVRVRDPEGGGDEREEALVVPNVAPVFASEPPTEGFQGELYEYAPVVVELGADAVGLALVEGPEGASFERGVLRWTPTRAQAREGTARFVLRASDEDGGSSEQAWEVALDFPVQAPSAPAWIEPVEGARVEGSSLVARWGLAVDPDGDALVYDVELSEAQDFGVVEAGGVGLEPEPGASEVALPLTGLALERAWWLRARARDVDGPGPWAVVSFQTVNQAPTRPTLLSPVDGARVEPGVVALAFAPGVDPDGHEVEHRVRVFDGVDLAGEVYAEVVAGQGERLEARFEVPAQVRAWFWTVEAVDALGASSGVVGPEEFNVGQESVNRAPEAPVLVSPEDGAQVSPEALALSVRAVADPDGDALRVSVWVWAGEEVAWEALDQALDDEGAWQGAPMLPLGAYTWAARVVDARGLESPTTQARAFSVIPADEEDADVGQDAGDVGQDVDDEPDADVGPDADVAEDMDAELDVDDEPDADVGEDVEEPDAKPDAPEDDAGSEDVGEDAEPDVGEDMDADAGEPIQVGGVGTEDDCGCDLSGAPARGWGWLSLVGAAALFGWRRRARG